MPIDKCIASAAGGTNQRLKLGCAVMYSLDKKLAMLSPEIFYIVLCIFLIIQTNYILLQITKNGNYALVLS